MMKRIAVFAGKILLLFLILECLLHLGGQWIITRYSFHHKAERLPEWVRDLPTMVKMHQISRPKSPGERRVVMIGNSAIRGGLVPASWALPAHLQQVLNQQTGEQKIQVYNLGLNGVKALEVFLVAGEAIRYQPDLVVWGFAVPDFTINVPWNDFAFLGFNLHYYSSHKDWFYQHGYRELYGFGWDIVQRHKWSQEEKEDYFLGRYSLLWRYRETWREILLDQVLYGLPSGLTQQVVNRYQGDVSLFRFEPGVQRWSKAYFSSSSPVYSAIRATRDLLQEQGITLLVFLQPLYPNYGIYPPEFLEGFRQLVHEEAAAQKINHADLLELLEPRPQFFFDYIHLTPAGNRRLAESLAPRVLEALKPQIP